MTPAKNPSASIRLLLTNGSGEEVALPLNDNLTMRSGMQIDWMPPRFYEQTGDLFALNRLKEDKGVTTLKSDHHLGQIAVTLGIREIFNRAIQAQKAGKMMVDLTAESSFDAMVKRAKAGKPAPARKR